jgi:hypothetical protein
MSKVGGYAMQKFLFLFLHGMAAIFLKTPRCRSKGTISKLRHLHRLYVVFCLLLNLHP